jgi:AAA+ ATPase superfamily predicted ATPase
MSHPEHIITAGKPVIGDQLIGRQKEIGLINHYLDTGQSVVLIAPRRYGKTSLLLEILRQRQRAGNYTASVDFFAIASILALAAEITAQVLSNKKWNWSVYQLRTQLFELLKNLQFRQTVDQYDFILGFGNAQPDEWQLLSESLKLIDTFAGENNRNIVCGFSAPVPRLFFVSHESSTWGLLIRMNSGFLSTVYLVTIRYNRVSRLPMKF